MELTAMAWTGLSGLCRSGFRWLHNCSLVGGLWGNGDNIALLGFDVRTNQYNTSAKGCPLVTQLLFIEYSVFKSEALLLALYMSSLG